VQNQHNDPNNAVERVAEKSAPHGGVSSIKIRLYLTGVQADKALNHPRGDTDDGRKKRNILAHFL
jgi:hypothetical protein